MGNCKIRFQNGEVRDCDYVRQNLTKLKVEFRVNNYTDLIIKRGGTDRAYIAYCNELESVLAKCKCSNMQTDNMAEPLNEDRKRLSEKTSKEGAIV